MICRKYWSHSLKSLYKFHSCVNSPAATNQTSSLKDVDKSSVTLLAFHSVLWFFHVLFAVRNMYGFTISNSFQLFVLSSCVLLSSVCIESALALCICSTAVFLSVVIYVNVIIEKLIKIMCMFISKVWVLPSNLINCYVLQNALYKLTFSCWFVMLLLGIFIPLPMLCSRAVCAYVSVHLRPGRC